MRQATLHLSDVLNPLLLSGEGAFKHYRNIMPLSDNNDIRYALLTYLTEYLPDGTKAERDVIFAIIGLL
jgi:hypothetical protein